MKTSIVNFLNKRIYRRYLYFKTINLFFLRIRLNKLSINRAKGIE